MIKILKRRVLTGCLAACTMLSMAGTGVLAQGTEQTDGSGAQMEGTYGGQPNYVYKAFDAAIQGSAVQDPLFSQQWGFYNDGSFQIKEKQNPYPIFDNPFEDPWNSGQWEISQEIMNDLMGPWVSESGAAVSGENSAVTENTGADNTGSENTGTEGSVKGVDINVKNAWNHFNTAGKKTIVATIDTGVDYSDEQISDAVWTNPGETAGDGIDNDGNGYVDDVYGWNFYNNNNKVFTGKEDNHGTHGAGTIVAKRDGVGTAGIAGSSNVKIMALKALGGRDGSGTTESIINAIKYAEFNGASICNLSLGTEGNDQALRKAIADSKMLFVAAAGNGSDWTGNGHNVDRIPTYPAAWNLDNLISVANIQSDGTLHYSSNYGTKTIDIAAPGSYILSTVAGDQYSYMTGTSMAAPMVSGVAAMLYSQYGDLTAPEAKNIIIGSVNTLSSLKGKVKTGGMLDAGAALAYDRSLAQKGSASDRPQPDTPQTPGTQPDQVVVTPKLPEDSQPSGGAQRHGSAPVIRLISANMGTKGYLGVNIWDADGDLKAVRYADGKKEAPWFDGGKNGTAFKLDQSGNGSFTYTDGKGVYTFYAVDSQGNETVSVVLLNDASHSLFDFSQLFRRVFAW